MLVDVVEHPCSVSPVVRRVAYLPVTFAAILRVVAHDKLRDRA